MVKHNMSYIEARRKVEAEENAVPTTAAVISSSLGNTQPATTSPPQTRSIHTQTDITWPLTSEQPITKEETTTQTTSEPVGGICHVCSSAASTSADACRCVTNAIPHLIAPRVSSSSSTALTTR